MALEQLHGSVEDVGLTPAPLGVRERDPEPMADFLEPLLVVELPKDIVVQDQTETCARQSKAGLLRQLQESPALDQRGEYSAMLAESREQVLVYTDGVEQVTAMLSHECLRSQHLVPETVSGRQVAGKGH